MNDESRRGMNNNKFCTYCKKPGDIKECQVRIRKERENAAQNLSKNFGNSLNTRRVRSMDTVAKAPPVEQGVSKTTPSS